MPENSPSQTSGVTAPDADEVAQKGDWVGQGIVPAEQDAPATEPVTPSAGDDAAATASADANLPDAEAVEPVDPSTVRPTVSDIKKADAAMDPMQAVRAYEESKRA
jgi:hypothetical protein